MSDPRPSLHYEERREHSLLELVLRDRRRDIAGLVTVAAAVLAVMLALYHLFVAGFGTPETLSFRSTHLATMMILAALVYPLGRRSISDPVLVL